MKKSKIKRIVLFIVVISSIVGILKLQGLYYTDLNEEFPRIDTSDSLSCEIIHLDKIKGTSYITANKKKFRLSSSQNYDYKNEYIHNNMFVGDSLSKNSGSDTIHIYSANGIKYFVHQNVINRPD